MSALRRQSSIRRATIGLGLAGLLSACSTDDLANKALEDAGVEINTRGGVPSDFPAEVPVPDLAIETAVAIDGGWVMRLTSPDAVANVAAYRAKLEKAGFSVTNAFDNSGDPTANNVGFDADNGTWTVQAVAFTQDKPVDPGYMGVSVGRVGSSLPAGSAGSGTSGSGASMPTGFPSAVPLPALAIQSASTFADGYTARLDSPDAVADIAAYTAQLEAAGFEITDSFDLSAGESRNVGVDAVGAGWEVSAVAFTQEHEGGAYMSLSVEPAD